MRAVAAESEARCRASKAKRSSRSRSWIARSKLFSRSSFSIGRRWGSRASWCTAVTRLTASNSSPWSFGVGLGLGSDGGAGVSWVWLKRDQDVCLLYLPNSQHDRPPFGGTQGGVMPRLPTRESSLKFTFEQFEAYHGASEACRLLLGRFSPFGLF